MISARTAERSAAGTDPYALLQIGSTTIGPGETLGSAWARGANGTAIAAEAGMHLEAIRQIGREDLKALYAAQSPASSPQEVSPSLFGAIGAAFQEFVAWIQETIRTTFS